MKLDQRTEVIADLFLDAIAAGRGRGLRDGRITAGPDAEDIAQAQLLARRAIDYLMAKKASRNSSEAQSAG